MASCLQGEEARREDAKSLPQCGPAAIALLCSLGGGEESKLQLQQWLLYTVHSALGSSHGTLNLRHLHVDMKRMWPYLQGSGLTFHFPPAILQEAKLSPLPDAAVAILFCLYVCLCVGVGSWSYRQF